MFFNLFPFLLNICPFFSFPTSPFSSLSRVYQSLEIYYNSTIIEFVFLNQRRIHDFNILSYRFFFTFYHYFFLLKSTAHFIHFVLSRTFGFCFRSYESVRIEVLLYWSRKRERERERERERTLNILIFL